MTKLPFIHLPFGTRLTSFGGTGGRTGAHATELLFVKFCPQMTQLCPLTSLVEYVLIMSPLYQVETE